MEPHFRNYQINHKFQEKDAGNWEKTKQNTKYFSETIRVDLPEASVQLEQAGLEQWRKCLEETTKS